MNGLGRPSVRAVVYTRKSSEEGLEQEFNSLDAQYEACTAYISSQRCCQTKPNTYQSATIT